MLVKIANPQIVKDRYIRITAFPIRSIERQFELKQRNETGNEPGYLIQV
jgi:hypothetical protein